MTNIEAIMVLIGAEAESRLLSRDDKDYAALLYQVDIEISDLIVEEMLKYRKQPRT